MDIDLFDRSKILTQLYMRYITLSKRRKNSFLKALKKTSSGLLTVFMKNCFRAPQSIPLTL